MLTTPYKLEKKIIWIIDSLGRGGAETLLVNLLPLLNNKYQIHLIVLSEINEFPYEHIEVNVDAIIFLRNNGIHSLLNQYFFIKKYVKKIQPDIIRGDLFYGNLLARVSAPKHIKTFFTIHSLMGVATFSKYKLILFIEKLIYKKNHRLIAVSQNVLQDYDSWINIKGKSFVLKNFISNDFYLNEKTKFSPEIKKIVCVGNIKEVKNYQLLLETLSNFPHLNNYFTFDIYGDGLLKHSLQETAIRNNLSINFKGSHDSIHKILKNYDAYLICSFYEGLPLAVAEAMTVGLPIIASDIPVLKETTNGLGYFFDPNNFKSLAEIITNIKNFKLSDKIHCYNQTKEAQRFALKHYSQETYLKNLQKIFDS